MKSVLVNKSNTIKYWVESIEETLEEKRFMFGKVSQGDAMDNLQYLRTSQENVERQLRSFNYTTPKYKVKDYQNYSKAIEKLIKKYEKIVYNF
jgi:predicted AlkP superfamily phosphohydrolase/phosphomutase